MFRFAIVLSVIDAEVELELRMPVTACPVELTEAVLALMLFAVEVLPIVLPEMVFVPEVTWIPTKL